MGYYSYKIEHDYGLAPNPFWGYCTLAVCKPKIRRNRNLNVGDWIIGTGTKKLKCHHRLIYIMQVEEIIPMKNYWTDERFSSKRPIVNGSLAQMYGDNFYRFDEKSNIWIQENGAHSLDDGNPNEDHLDIDVKGLNVLISKKFYYFGDNNIEIPAKFIEVCCEGRDMKSNSIPTGIADQFINWIEMQYDAGIYGDPINWKEYK